MPYSIVTSSYAEWRPDMGAPIRITLGTPKFIAYELAGMVSALAPDRRIFNLPGLEFTRAYNRQLDLVGAPRISAMLDAVMDSRSESRAVLLCFEKSFAPGFDCHRRDFAKWWERRTGENIPEASGRLEVTHAVQGTLF